MNEFLVHLGSIVLSWALIIGITFLCTAWCFSYAISLKQTIFWVASLLLIPSCLFLMWATEAKKILFPLIVCILALHTFLLCAKNYLIKKYNVPINAVRFYTTVAILYGFFILGCWGLLVLKNQLIIEAVVVTCNYFIFIAIVGMFFLMF